MKGACLISTNDRSDDPTVILLLLISLCLNILLALLINHSFLITTHPFVVFCSAQFSGTKTLIPEKRRCVFFVRSPCHKIEPAFFGGMKNLNQDSIWVGVQNISIAHKNGVSIMWFNPHCWVNNNTLCASSNYGNLTIINSNFAT